VPLIEVAGKPLWSVLRLRPNGRSVAQESFDQLIAGTVQSVGFVSQWLRKDGRKARMSWTARAVDFGDGRRLVVATGTETTRGRQVARDREETESRFEKLLALLPDPVIVHQNGLLAFANRAALDLYGAHSIDELTGRQVIDFVAPESRAFASERIARMLAFGGSEPLAHERHVKLDGTVFDVGVAAAPVVFDGRPAIEVIVRDVTARNEIEAALRASEARVRAVFDQSALGMVLVDRDGKLLESNAAYQRLVGYDAEELAGTTVWDFTHPEDLASTRSQLQDLFAGRTEGAEYEKRYVTKTGKETWVHVHVALVHEGEAPPGMAVGTVEDITAHEALEDQLRQSSKMEALGRLAGGVAHDFNNILTVVNGYADLLAISLDGDERAAEATEIKKAGTRATELTAQLLAFGRRSKRALESVDLNDRIEAMVPMLRRLLGEDIELTVLLDQSLGAVEADPSQLDQLVMNLVANGRDAMPGGGSLGIETSRLDGGAPVPGPSSGWAKLEIADSGFGMEPAVLEHIFEPFFTTKGQGKGTGLGLATVYGIVQQMGGHVRVESMLGSGSTFIVELPLREPAFDSGKVVAAGAALADLGTETVLVVEDEPAVRDLCKMALTAKGYRVYVAGPQDALEIAGSLGSGLDILVTDVVMPDLDGPTIAAALRSKRPDLKVLFMSGYPLDREDDLTGAAGEGAVLRKPFVPRELCDAVRRVLDRPASGS
jgi:PAS domain S-box-containing protein